jgi:leucyl aminopeptidase
MGAGALLSVGKGSRTPSRLIVLEYPGKVPEANTDPVVLVGKAITFDTGGYSIKDTSGIQGMKYDKCGGLAVIATLWAAAQLKLKTPLIGLIPAAENMISSEAYRPDDILTSLSGKTIEVLSTDAEGRLVLADALTYAQRMFKPRAVIDLATLTGGVVVALGHIRAGMMANDDRLAGQLLSAGEAAYERLWRLPLDEEYFELIKGDEADIKNSGGREGAPIFGGIFLKQFVDDQVPWAHLDIAGMASPSKDLPYCPQGATGSGVRLLLEDVEAF